MTVVGCYILVVVLCFLHQSRSLEKLPVVEENDIVKTDAAIRNTTNELFGIFKLRSVHNLPKIKQYSSIHKYFISLTLQDYDSLNEIAQLTRVDKNKMEFVIADFIALLNEVLDEENVVTLIDAEEGYDIVQEFNKIENMRNKYMGSNTLFDINGQILKILKEDKTASCNNSTLPFLSNETESSEFQVENDTLSRVHDGVWRPEDAAVPSRRIFGGVYSKVDYYSFLASVQFFGKFQCGSSIIKTDLAITSASCLQLAWNNQYYRENPAFLSIRVGSSFYENGGESIPIIEIFFYPSYNPQKLTHNLAIMRTVRHIFWKKKVKMIEIDRIEQPLPLNTEGIVIVGWGAMTSTGKLHSAYINRLQFSVLDVYPLDECQEVYTREYVTSRNFCAGFISRGEGACNRDIGGPGIVAGYLTGVISFGAPVCGTPDAPTVFTKVGFYTDWIEEIMETIAPHAKKRTTTTRSPKDFFYYVPELLNETKTKYSKNEPISTTKLPKSLQTEDLISLDLKKLSKETKMNLVRTQEKRLFKEFLKTLFDSNEVQEYLETQKDTNPSEMVMNTYNVAQDSEYHVQTATESHVYNSLLPVSFDNVVKKSSIELSRELNQNEDGPRTGIEFEPTTNHPDEETNVVTTSDEREVTASLDVQNWDLNKEQEPEIPEISDALSSKENEVDTGARDTDVELEDRIVKLINSFTVPSSASDRPKMKKKAKHRSSSADLSPKKKDEEVNEAMKDQIDTVVLSLLRGDDKQKTFTTHSDYEKKLEENNEIENDKKSNDDYVSEKERKKGRRRRTKFNHYGADNNYNHETEQKQFNDYINTDTNPAEETEPTEHFLEYEDKDSNKKTHRKLLVEVLKEMLGDGS